MVQQSRLRDGSRKIVSIAEIVGMEADTVTIQDLFYYKQEGLDLSGKLTGQFLSTGIRPSFAEKLTQNGILVRDDWFVN